MNTIESFFPHLKISPFLYLSDVVGPIGAPTAESKGDSFEVFENIFVEVQSKGGEVALNGSGRLLVSVLGIEQSSLIRRNIGDFGTLTTSEKGEQIIKLSRDDIIL